jgi:hypothetical protein
MEKIIFLDIDGVLAIPSCLKDGMWALSDEIQKLLGKILDQTDAKIVLSSSWRYATLERTKEHMESEGFLFNDKLIGVTIRAYHYLEKGSKIHLSIPRGVEIKQWIDTHIHSDNGKNWERKKVGKDFTYIILDDDRDMLLEQKDHFLNTNSEIGLTDDIVERAVAILNNCS